MWRNFSTIVGVYCNFCRFVAKSVNHTVLLRNFCPNLRAFRWRKIKPKSTFVEKKWQISCLPNHHHHQFITILTIKVITVTILNISITIITVIRLILECWRLFMMSAQRWSVCKTLMEMWSTQNSGFSILVEEKIMIFLTSPAAGAASHTPNYSPFSMPFYMLMSHCIWN